MSCPTPKPGDPCYTASMTARQHQPPPPPDLSGDKNSEAIRSLPAARNTMSAIVLPAYTGINSERVSAEAKRVAGLPSSEQPAAMKLLISAVGDIGAKAAMQLAKMNSGSVTVLDTVQEAIQQAHSRLKAIHPDIDPAVFYRDSSNSFAQAEFQREFESALGMTPAGVAILTSASVRDVAFTYARAVTCVYREIDILDIGATVAKAKALGLRPSDLVRQKFNLLPDVLTQIGPAITYFDQNQEPDVAPIMQAIITSEYPVQIGRIAEKIQAFIEERKGLNWMPALELVSPVDNSSPMARKLQATVEVLGGMVRAGRLSQYEYEIIQRVAQQAMGQNSTQEMLSGYLLRTVRTLNDLPTRTVLRTDSVMPVPSLDIDTYSKLGIGIADVIRGELSWQPPAEVEKLSRRVQAAIRDVEEGRFGSQERAVRVVHGVTDDVSQIKGFADDLSQHLGQGDVRQIQKLAISIKGQAHVSKENEPLLLVRIMRLLFDLR